VPVGEGEVLGVFVPISVEWHIFHTEMYSKVDNISVCTIYHWNRRFIDFPKIQSSSRSMLEFKRNMQKFNSTFNVLAA